MAIRNTQVDKTLQDLNLGDEASILTSVLGVTRLPCCICSPLRKDKKPSFSLYIDKKNHVRYIDHATNEHGSLMDLLMSYWGCTFIQALQRICALTEYQGHVQTDRKVHGHTLKIREEKSIIEVKTRPWQQYDFDYWSSYGVSPWWLQYAEVYPISQKIAIKQKDNSCEASFNAFKADKYAYVFIERKNGKIYKKIYQPYNTKGFKWMSKMGHSVISLWTKIPEHGDKVIICSSLKDALCVACQLHIPTLALQGEGYDMPEKAISELKERYKKIYIAYDTDEPGVKDGKKLAEQTGFTQVIPDLGLQKDFSDYYKSLQNKDDFKQLSKLFN